MITLQGPLAKTGLTWGNGPNVCLRCSRPRRQRMRKRTMGTNDGTQEDAIVRAYLAGTKIEDMEREFGVGRSTIYHVLHRSDIRPGRMRQQLGGASKDAALAGLYELIKHQDRVIAERDTKIAALTSELTSVKRRLQRVQGGSDGHDRTKRVASKRRAAG